MSDPNFKLDKKFPDTERKIRKNFLTQDETNKIKILWKEVKKKETEGQRDAKSFFEIVYLGFLKEIEDRKAVEEDLKELQKQFDECANKMAEILEKSKSS